LTRDEPPPPDTSKTFSQRVQNHILIANKAGRQAGRQAGRKVGRQAGKEDMKEVSDNE
jgi:hypothetical protein